MKSQSRLKYKPSSDFILIGISSSENLIRLGWILNKSLRLKLTMSEKLSVYQEKLETPQEFQMFKHTNLHGKIVYRLIDNKSENGYLSPTYKEFDFILQCIKQNEHDIENLLKQIRRSEDIIFASILDKPGKDLTQKLLI